MTASSQKLSTLLRLLWQNPVFGDSFAGRLEAEMMRLFEAVHISLKEVLLPLLRTGMPDASEEQVRQVFDEVAPKSVAFCAAISAGEISDVEALADAAAAIALSYWADQSMDRGDESMLRAVQILNGGGQLALSPQLQALEHIEGFTRKLALDVRDVPYVLRAIQRDVLGNQALLRQLSQVCLLDCSETFWQAQAEQVARLLVDCSGLMSAVSILYALYRRFWPALPSLAEIESEPALFAFIRQTCNPAVRIFDDAGDSRIDAGQQGQWGVFNLNVINQNHPLLVKHFLALSGLQPDDPDYAELEQAFFLPLQERRVLLVLLYRNLARRRLATLDIPTRQKYDVFLSLVKRTLEGAFVNLLGDIFLTEGVPADALEQEFLRALQTHQLLSLERI